MPKEAISIRIPKPVLDWFKQNSDHYQTEINQILADYVAAQIHIERVNNANRQE